jgi:hypothetical protein
VTGFQIALLVIGVLVVPLFAWAEYAHRAWLKRQEDDR